MLLNYRHLMFLKFLPPQILLKLYAWPRCLHYLRPYFYDSAEKKHRLTLQKNRISLIRSGIFVIEKDLEALDGGHFQQ